MASFSSFTDWLKKNSSPYSAAKNAVSSQPAQSQPQGFQGFGGGGTFNGNGGGASWDTPIAVAGATTTNQQGGASGASVGYGTGEDSAQKNSTYNVIKNKLGSLKSVFDGLFSSIDNVVKERTADLQKQQQSTLDDLSNQYLKADSQTRSIYGARGLSDSSYVGDALGQNNDIFNRSFDDVGNQFNQKAGALGQFAAAQKGALQSQLQNTQQYVDSLGQNIGNLGLADLVGADQQLGQAIGSAQQSASNYMTNPQMLAELNKITPINNAGTAQLANRLQALVTSSAPIFAKRQIAQGLVKASGLQDENAKGYWNNMFEDLLKKSGQA